MCKILRTIAIACTLASPGAASAGHPVVDYIKDMQKTLSNSAVEYKMTCIYPGNTSLEVAGRMAMQGNKYYDSSNARFVLFNDRWEVMANHLEKAISVTYLPRINSMFKGAASLTVSSYLFSGEFMMEKMQVSKLRESNDTLWYKITLEDQQMLEYLEIRMLKGFKLLGYKARINYPLAAMGIPAEDDAIMHITYEATSVTTPAPLILFDSKRIIKEKGKKATLVRYNNYKISTSTTPKG